MNLFHKKLFESLKFSFFLSILFWILSILILFAPIKSNFNFYDEGFAVFNASRILDGDIPYKDFWQIYPPGQGYLLSIIFKIFGESLLVSRIFDTLSRFIIVYSIWIITKKLNLGYLSYLSIILTSILLSSVNAYSYVAILSTSIGLVSNIFFIYFLKNQKLFWLILSGILAGLNFLFRWDIGSYFFVSISISIIINALRNNKGQSFFVSFGYFISPVITILIFGYGMIIHISGFSNFLDQVFLFPILKLHEVRGLPYPSFLSPLQFFLNLFSNSKEANFVELMNWHYFYFPILIFILNFLLWLKKSVKLNSYMLIKINLSLLGLLLFAQALSRFDYAHVFPSLLISSVLYISFFNKDFFRRLLIAEKFLISLLLPGFICFNFLIPVIQISNYDPVFDCYSRIDKANCIRINQDQEHAINFIRANTHENEKIFVGNQRHDLIYVNDIGFYFLSDLRSVTAFSDLFPGIATTLAIQEEISQEIEIEQINWIVIVNIPPSSEPNLSSESSGITYLDDYIKTNFFEIKEFGNYKILRKNN